MVNANEYEPLELSHLHPAAQPVARLPAAERVQRIRADRWIGYPKAVEAVERLETMLGWPEVRGVAEVMDMHGVLHGSERMQEIIQAGLNSGKLIEGHARGLRGADLQAYLAAGVTSDHELTSADDALEKLRAGLTIEIRGSHPYLLPDIVTALKTLPHLSSQITVCTDDVPPDMLLEKGGIIALLNLLIEHGLPATDVLRFATLNAAIRLQRNDLGLIAAGRRADSAAGP